VPFMARGVDILHIIPTPFPAEWHTMEDDGEHLDMASVHDWTKIVTAFVVEWMELKDSMPKRTASAPEKTQTNTPMSKRTEL
jgi:glutaminyl-peptide cyclotransferase